MDISLAFQDTSKQLVNSNTLYLHYPFLIIFSKNHENYLISLILLAFKGARRHLLSIALLAEEGIFPI